MKKLFFIAVAAMAIAACTKTEVNTPQNLISFQPASQLNTKVTGSVFPQTETFGAFAWTAGTSTTYFIDNNVVSFSNGQWSTATPYYWPKNQTVDFFCYYPFDTAGSNPTVVSETQIKYDVDFSKASSQVKYHIHFSLVPLPPDDLKAYACNLVSYQNRDIIMLAAGKVHGKCHEIINRYDAELKKAKGAAAVKISEKANAETAKMVEEETSKVLSSVLKEACNVMKNSYARSDA